VRAGGRRPPKPGAGFVGRAGGPVRAALCLFALGLAAPGAAAQALNLGATDSKLPIEIFADQGIEWQQDGLVFLARGNARAVRGDVEVLADELRAFYRNTGGGTEIWRLDAAGSVRIRSPSETAYGNSAVYDVDSAVLVLTGGKPRLVTANEELTAERQIEYWEQKQMAVARGNALAKREDKSLSADVLAAYFRKDAAGKSRIYRVDAFDRVRIVTPEETAVAERGVYNVDSGVATLAGSVRITRVGNVIDGCSAEYNMNTGVSKMFACKPTAGGTRRVHGLIQPAEAKKAREPAATGKEK
jgi:lipopolysaccharide export system protein LptA